MNGQAKQEPLDLSTNDFVGAAKTPINGGDNSGMNDLALPSSSSPSSPPRGVPMNDRQRALQQAQQVLAAVPTQELDGFNLLGVVANPRASSLMSPTQSAASATASSRVANARLHPDSISNASPASGSIAESIHALESTLSHVTEQIDNLNVVFDQWSRQYLGTLYYEDDSAALLDYVPPTEVEGQRTELPPELAELTLHSVQQYLEQSGVLGQQFWQRSREQETWLWHEMISPDSELGDNVEANEEAFMEQLQETVPSLFFQTYLDLTDSKVFEELLVASEEEGDAAAARMEPLPPDDEENSMQNLPKELTTATRDILRLPPQDAFTGLLDKVELALLQQVRSKSIAFFHETNRFGQLKEWIAGLVQEVQRVRQLLDSFQHKSVVAWELIPLLDKQRQDLVVLSGTLESANEVVRCKASIGGLLSANDDLGAAEQVQYGRRLLLAENGDLRRLEALRTVQDQFTQYETLIVANLGEELVEMLLEWKSLSLSSSRQDQTRVRELVQGLQKCSALPRVGRLYSNRSLDVIRMTVRTTVGEFADEADSSVKVCVTSMTLDRFIDCLDMLFEQLMDVLKSAVGVKSFFAEFEEEIVFTENDTVTAAAELSSKSISELLRLRKEAHSLVALDGMKRLWDVNMSFTLEMEQLCSYKATGLRSTLLSQAKAFVERQHEANMSKLVAALDSERWTQCDVSAERQAALTRLCTGRAVVIDGSDTKVDKAKSPDAEVEGTRYKVVWSCLLMVEMMLTNIYCAAHFPSLATNVVGKVSELLRLFNSRSTQLVLGAGAIHSAARLKSINAKHLSLVTQCLGMTIAVLPYVRAALMAQLPPKQHNLLNDLDKIKKEFADHNEKVLNKFVTIIGGIVEHGLAPRIGGIDFDSRAKNASTGPPIACCVFLEGVSTNTRKMHQVLNALLPPDHLQDVFSRIFAYIDQLIPSLFKASSERTGNNNGGRPQQPFKFPTTDAGKERMLLEVETMIANLNGLVGVRPWDFTAVGVLERQMDYELPRPEEESKQSEEVTEEQPKEDETKPSLEDENTPDSEKGALNGGDAHNHDDTTFDREAPSEAE